MRRGFTQRHRDATLRETLEIRNLAHSTISLLRLSYAQALLLREDANVLRVAMESGFGSLSAFNKSFRKIAGMSPSDFRRDAHDMPLLASSALAS